MEKTDETKTSSATLLEEERSLLFDFQQLVNASEDARARVPADFSTTQLTQEETAYLELVEQDAKSAVVRHREKRKINTCVQLGGKNDTDGGIDHLSADKQHT